MPSDKIKNYIESVCEQIRWKKAKPVIGGELEDHISDQMNAYISEGMTEQAATEKAILDMGDPISVGTQFDRVYRPKTEWSIIGLTALLLIAGLAIRFLFVYESSDAMDNMITNSLLYAAVGILFMFLTYSLDFTVFGKYPRLIFFLVLGVSSAVYLGYAFYNRYPKHVNMFNINLYLLAFTIVYAGIVYKMRTKGYWGIITCGLYYLGSVVWVLFLNGLPSYSSVYFYSTTGIFLFSICGLFVLTLAIMKGWFNIRKLYGMLIVYTPVTVIASLLINTFAFRTKRLAIAINPTIDPMGAGYQVYTLRKILSGTVFIGGAENLPDYAVHSLKSPLFNADTDFLLTFLAVCFGYIAVAVVAVMFLAFIIRGIFLSHKQTSVLGKLISSAVLFVFSLQVFFYFLANLGLPLFTNPPLPLLSYDGLSTVVNMALIGILLSVFKSGKLVRDQTRPVLKHNKLLEIVNGKIVIDLRSK